MRTTVHYGVVILVLIVLAVFSALGLGRFGYSMVLPAMQKAMGLSNVQTGELQSANLVGYLLVVAAAGALAARYGPRVVISLALFVGGVSMLGTGLFPTFRAACVARLLTGAAGAAVNVPAMGLVSAWFARRRRGLASGIGVTGSSLGLIFTGPLVPVVLERCGADGWRVCWGIFGGVSLAICLVASLLLRNRPEEVHLGAIGAAEGPAVGPSPAASVLDWAKVYRSRYLWRLAAVYFAFGFSYIIYSTFFVKHLVRELDMSTTQAGRLWLQVGLASIVSGFLWGMVSDRWGRRLALIAIFVLQAASFTILGKAGSVAVVYVSAGLFAITAWSIPAVMAALAGDRFGPRLAPAALGLITIVFGIGQALGPYVGGWLADLTQSLALSFVLAGAVALFLGAGGALLLQEHQEADACASEVTPGSGGDRAA